MDRVFYRATLNPPQQVSMLESIFLFPIPRNYSIIHALHPTNEPLTLFQLFLLLLLLLLSTADLFSRIRLISERKKERGRGKGKD